MSFAKLVYQLGILYQNNQIPKNLAFLLESQYWDHERLKNHQLVKLKELVNHAYSNSRYYRKLFKNNDFHPDDIKSLTDVRKIPLLTKEDILSHRDDIQIKDYPEKLIYSETSGSTGKPLVFYRNQNWDAMHRASAFRGYSWYDVNPWNRNGYLWGYNFALKKRLKVKFLDFLQNRFRLFSYNDKEMDSFITKLEKASFLSGYSSMIYEIAKKVNKSPLKNKLNLRMILGTSEKIYEKYQQEVKSAFGKKIISEYGAAETGIIAFECPSGNMHINMETVLTEEIENEIVVTNLYSMSFPIIRYKLGDYVKFDTGTICECGRKHPIIKEVTGRVGKVIYGKDQTYPSLTLYYVFKNLAMEHEIIMNYQVVQDEKGYLNLYVEGNLNNLERNLLIEEFKKYFHDDIQLKICENTELISKTAKKKDFISTIKIEN